MVMWMSTQFVELLWLQEEQARLPNERNSLQQCDTFVATELQYLLVIPNNVKSARKS